MDPELSLEELRNDIISASEQCIRKLSGDNLANTEHSILETEFVRPDFCSFIPLQGDLSGYFLIGVMEKSVDNVIDLMGADEIPLDRQNKLQVSLDELGNTLAGRIITLLNDWRDVDVEIGTPIFMNKEDLAPEESVSNPPTLKAEFELESGVLILQLSIIPRKSSLQQKLS